MDTTRLFCGANLAENAKKLSIKQKVIQFLVVNTVRVLHRPPIPQCVLSAAALHLNLAVDRLKSLHVNSPSYSTGASLIISSPLACLQ